MKRILFLSMVYPRSYERTRGTFCYAMCKALVQLGCEMRVVSPRSWMECLRCPDPKDERFFREVGPTEFPCYYYPPGALQSTYGWWMWHSIKRSLLATCREFRPDGIISYWAHPDGAVAVRLGQHLGVPVGTIVGGSDVLLLTRNPRRRKVIAESLRAADAVFAVSRDLQQKTIELGVDPRRVHVNYQGVDEAFCPGDRDAARQRLKLSAAAPLLLWVGRMAPVKGLEVMFEAMGQLVRSRPDIQLVLVGDGPLRSSLEHQAKSAGLAANIRFVGAVEQAALPDWYRAADLTVLSSHSEGIPNVLRESLACGTPYVATRVGGIAELCDHPAIRLVPPGDSSALAIAIDESLTSGSRIEGFASCSWESCAEQLLGHMDRAGVRTEEQLGALVR